MCVRLVFVGPYGFAGRAGTLTLHCGQNLPPNADRTLRVGVELFGLRGVAVSLTMPVLESIVRLIDR